MVDRAVVGVVSEYLTRVAKSGIAVQSGVLFGSFARGEQTADSDIDLMVLASDFDGRYNHELIDRLWSLRRFVDSRIEPHAVGVKQFAEDTASPIIGIARREGIAVPFPCPQNA